MFQSWHNARVPSLPVPRAVVVLLPRVDVEVLRAQASAVLSEVWLTARTVQRLMMAVADAIDDGLLAELRSGFEDIRRAVELMEQVTVQIDQALPVLEATAPALGLMNGSIAQLNSTVAQLEGLPGVRMARRLVSRPGAMAD